MKVAVALSLALLSSASAFAPTPFTTRQQISLQVELEGREIEGALVPCTNFILVKVAEAEDQTEGYPDLRNYKLYKG